MPTPVYPARNVATGYLRSGGASRGHLRELLDQTCERLVRAEENQDEVEPLPGRLSWILASHAGFRCARGGGVMGGGFAGMPRTQGAGPVSEDPLTGMPTPSRTGIGRRRTARSDLRAGRILAPPEASSLGRRIFHYTTAAPAPAGVRARRGFMADLIDRFADHSAGRTCSRWPPGISARRSCAGP